MHERLFPLQPSREMDQEVCDLFDAAAGAKWQERDAYKRNLLHIIAVHLTVKAKHRADHLLEKNIDSETKDMPGKTVPDVARHIETWMCWKHCSGNYSVSKVLPYYVAPSGQQ